MQFPWILSRLREPAPIAKHGEERSGDIKHSLADISKAKNLLGYHPVTSPVEGLRKTYEWYKEHAVIFAQ